MRARAAVERVGARRLDAVVLGTSGGLLAGVFAGTLYFPIIGGFIGGVFGMLVGFAAGLAGAALPRAATAIWIVAFVIAPICARDRLPLFPAEFVAVGLVALAMWGICGRVERVAACGVLTRQLCCVGWVAAGLAGLIGLGIAHSDVPSDAAAAAALTLASVAPTAGALLVGCAMVRLLLLP